MGNIGSRSAMRGPNCKFTSSVELFCFDLSLYLYDLVLGEPTNIIFMISGVWDVSLAPKTNYVYLWRPQDMFKNLRQNPNRF